MGDGFTESAFVEKLSRLDNSSRSIQSLSEWVINHRNHYTSVVKIWVREIIKAQEHRRITLMYFANEVIQSSRKIGRQYSYEFGRDLEKVCKHMSDSDEKTKNEIGRLFSIWLERKIYSELHIGLFQRALVMGFKDPFAILRARTRTTNQSKPEERVPVEVDGIFETQVRPHTSPDSHKIIKAIQGLESNLMSSSVQNVTKIANLNTKIPDVSTIALIQDKEEAENFVIQVDDAVAIANQSKTILASEVQQRKKLANMMKQFLQVQEELISQGENSLQEYEEKLSDIYRVRQRILDRMQSFGDITVLPDDAVEIFLQ